MRVSAESPRKEHPQADQRAKCGTESCKSCGFNQANPRDIWNSEPVSCPIDLHGIGVISVCSVEVGSLQ